MVANAVESTDVASPLIAISSSSGTPSLSVSAVKLVSAVANVVESTDVASPLMAISSSSERPSLSASGFIKRPSNV